MKELLYRASWQQLRVSFLQEHRNDGGWTTITGTTRNLGKVLEYVDGNQEFHEGFIQEAASMGYGGDVERSVRLYRTINCLNAVRMGNSGQGRKGEEHDLAVLKVRDHLQSRQTIMYHQHLSKAVERWDWRVVEQELMAMYNSGPEGFLDFERIYDSLVSRIKVNDRRLRDGSRTITTRRELVTFVTIMDQVMDAKAEGA